MVVDQMLGREWITSIGIKDQLRNIFFPKPAMSLSTFSIKTSFATFSLSLHTIEHPFDYTAISVSGKVGRPLTGLTTPVGWLLLLQLTVLSRSGIVVKSNFWWRFHVVKLLFECFCECRGFCHRTESELFLFLLKHLIFIFFSGRITAAAQANVSFHMTGDDSHGGLTTINNNWNIKMNM